MIASLIPILLSIDGPKTGLKLLDGQAEASLLFFLCSSKRKEMTILFIIYGGRHFFVITMGDVIDLNHMHINKGKAYGRQGKAPTGIIFNIVYYSCSTKQKHGFF